MDDSSHADGRPCSTFLQRKPANDFTRGGVCRQCLADRQREYRKANTAKVREHDARGYAKHRDERIAAATAYYEANRDAVKQRVRDAYAAEDRDARNAQRKEWRDANRDRAAEYTRRYRAKHPLLTITTNNNRRARIAGLTVTLAEVASIWTGECALCASPIEEALRFPDPWSRSLDHIVPLAKGGRHEVTNLQWTHLLCNMKKSDSIK